MLMVPAVHATRETSGGNSSPALSQSLWLRPWTNVSRSSLSLELPLNGEQCIHGHTNSLKTALTDSKGRINQSAVRNATSLEECQLFCPPGLHSEIRMTLDTTMAICRCYASVTSDPWHRCPTTAGAIRLLSALSCPK